jgi:hypothetical protein
MCSTLARSVKGMSWMLSGGRPARSPPAWRAAARARLLSMASLPPRRMVALPVLKQSEAASVVTLGRDSKMMPMTPMGTRTLRMCRPLGRVQSVQLFADGIGQGGDFAHGLGDGFMRFGSSVRRSSMAEERPFSVPAAISLALAANNSGVASRIAAAMARRMAFFSSDESWAS